MTPLKSPSRLTRLLSATGALLTTVLLMSSVLALALRDEPGAPMQAAVVMPVGSIATPTV